MPDSVGQKPPQMLADRYVLGNVIASGGMAEVWQARDDVLARTVAVKILRPDLAGDQTFVERFKREALAAARLTHPHIVAIYDTGSEQHEDSPRHYIVMEHCDGGTLRTMMSGAPFEPTRLLNLVAPVCDALDYAHSHGVIHRDLKPENVLVSHQGSLKVADFGIAKAAFAKGDITTTGTIIGTVTYISPEQASGVEPDHRSDLYSLGVLIYEALVGRPPFKEESDIATALAHLNNDPPPLRSIKAGVPKALDLAVLKALAKDPADRYQSAGEMHAALDNALDSGSTQVLRAPARRTSSYEETPPRKNRAGLWLVLTAVIAVLAILFFALDRDNDNGLIDEKRDQQQQQPANGGGSAAGTVAIESASDFDPHGDGAEHSDEVGLAHDADPSTSWSSETYRDTLALVKPGMGLVFDLGSSQEVSEVVVDLGDAGYNIEIKAADEIGADETAFDGVADVSESQKTERFRFEPVSARYWLVWITKLPSGTGGAANIAEVKFIGP